MTRSTARPFATLDLYRDVHKGIRSELFAVTEEAGRADPGEPADRVALTDHLRSVVDLLVDHACHEDIVRPALEEHLPTLAERVSSDHDRLDAWLHDLVTRADDAVATGGRSALHHLYLDLASFSVAYLEHQDLEERTVMPALEAAVGIDAVAGIHQTIVAGIAPGRLVRFLAVMLPAMNVDDRVDLLGGLRAGLSRDAFDGIWSLAGSVLTGAEQTAVAKRLGIGVPR